MTRAERMRWVRVWWGRLRASVDRPHEAVYCLGNIARASREDDPLTLVELLVASGAVE